MIAIAVCFVFTVKSQDIAYAKEVLTKLTKSEMKGRGYVKQGDRKAAEYLAGEFEKNGLKPLDSSYFQPYTFNINTFPGRMMVKIDGAKLIPGEEYVVGSSASTIRGEFPLFFLPDEVDSLAKLNAFIDGKSFASTFLVTKNPFKEIYSKTVPGVLGVIVLTEKEPGWSVRDGLTVESTYWIKMRNEKMLPTSSTIKINVENELLRKYSTQNVIGYVEGKVRPDRFIVYTAHYDHLGMMGKSTMFPGANDNASGTAMLMDLAKFYAQPENQPDWSIAFMAFSGEEAGLLGSTHYVKNPLFRLEAINLLINLDMVGTGSDGITIVNGIAYKELYDDFVEINTANNYVAEIKDRGEACNSDHCPFYNEGVKSIFIYTMGKEHMAYHNTNDTPSTLPLTSYDGLFKLLITYVATLN